MQTDEFYQEANGMQPGWGDYLKSIDELRERFDAGARFSLKEACWILWAERCVLSDDWRAFEVWAQAEGFSSSKLKWVVWSKLFDAFIEERKSRRAT